MKITKKQMSVVHTKYVFTESGDSHNDIQTETKIDDDGTEVTNTIEVRFRALDSIYAWSENFHTIEGLIKTLKKGDGLLIPQFLLRAQLVEFALKHLLLNAPYKPAKGLGKKPVDNMTMGEVINKLEQCNDSHLSNTIAAAKNFKDLRNEITHNLIDSGKSQSEIEQAIEDKLDIATEIEKQIIFFIDYVGDVLADQAIN